VFNYLVSVGVSIPAAALQAAPVTGMATQCKRSLHGHHKWPTSRLLAEWWLIRALAWQSSACKNCETYP